MAIRFECIWKKEALNERNHAIALWNKYRIFPREEMLRERVQQIVFVAKTENEEVIAVSTVRPEKVKLLNDNYLYEFRCFVSPENRAPALDTQLVVKTKDFFENNPDQSDHACIGLFMVIENEMIKKEWTKAVWAGANMVFAGYTTQGHHIRVCYFKGARI
jgi:hypothetical protein